MAGPHFRAMKISQYFFVFVFTMILIKAVLQIALIKGFSQKEQVSEGFGWRGKSGSSVHLFEAS